MARRRGRSGGTATRRTEGGEAKVGKKAAEHRSAGDGVAQ